jgi:hypothetical protein
MSNIANSQKDQQHPLWRQDREVVNTLLREQPTDYNLAELARLKIRYTGFPGARDIQRDLDQVLQNWSLTEAALFAKTRQIHAGQPVYNCKGRSSSRNEGSWADTQES